jgi:hypothetical protein
VDQTSGTNPTDAEAPQGSQGSQPLETQPDGQPGFRSRGRARRRARFLRRARELAYRDLGGLVYNLHRFGSRNDALVLTKLGTLSHIDGELRAIETTLQERHPVTVLREAGITACPRCAAIHGSEDRFCPNCGLPMSRHADLPVAGAPAPVSGQPPGAAPSPGPGAPQQPGVAAPPQPVAQTSAPQAAPPPPAPPQGAQPPQPQPVTAQHQVLATPPAASPARAPLPNGGRAPAPPMRATPPGAPVPPTTSTASAEEQTEIIRPQAPGS